MFSDPDFIKCYGVTLSEERVKAIIEHDACALDEYGYASLAWFERGTGNFVGRAGLSRTTVEEEDVVEVSYALVKAFWGKGLAVEIGHYAIDYAFNHLKLPELLCFTLPSNKQSLSVMEKLGFHYEKDFMYKGLLHKLYQMKNPL